MSYKSVVVDILSFAGCLAQMPLDLVVLKVAVRHFYLRRWLL